MNLGAAAVLAFGFATLTVAGGLAHHFRQRIRLGRTIAARAVCACWEPPEARATVVVVGDSTAVGVGAEDPSLSIAGRIAKEYPHARVCNYARSGAEVADLAAQLDRHNDQRADLMLIQACANDVLNKRPIADVERDLRAAVERAKAMGARVVLMPGCNFGFAPFFKPLFPPPSLLARARELHQMVRRVADDTGSVYVDLFHLDRTHPFFREGHRYFCADGLHPSGEGYAFWFSELARRVPLGQWLGQGQGAD